MGKEIPIRVYDYVNHPDNTVRERLVSAAPDIFHDATKGAASRLQTITSELHVNYSGFELSADISIKTKNIHEHERSTGSGPVTVIELEWEAVRHPGLFPLMKAELHIYPLTPTETQLELSGRYEPPFGLLGSAMDSVALGRIADASVKQFITEVAVYLRNDLK